MQTNNHNIEQTRVEWLVGLAKVWGTVKYFHPYLAYRVIDWDTALTDTIPKVNAAKTLQEYSEAINSMLSVLNDQYTFAWIPSEKPQTPTQAPTSEHNELIYLRNDILVIDVPAVNQAIAESYEIQGQLIQKTTQILSQAKAVLIDLRIAGRFNDECPFYLSDSYLRVVLTAMLDQSIPLASLRSRMHNGYAPQIGTTSGGYYSAFITTVPETLSGISKTKTLPMVFLISENLSSANILVGLQSANLAFVIQEGTAAQEIGDTTTTTTWIKVLEDIEVTMRTEEVISPDGVVGCTADLVVPQGEAIQAALRIIAENQFISNRSKVTQSLASQISYRENPYAEMEFPITEYRLLALFRFWNVINYFYPYKDLLDTPWDGVLAKFIAKFEANQDAADYQMTVSELAAMVQDSHVRVGNTQKMRARFGKFRPPFVVRFIEGQPVIISVFDESAGVKPGDAILSVDDEPVEKYCAELSHYYAASTPQALHCILPKHILLGAEGTKVRLTVRGLDSKVRTVEVSRTLASNDPRFLFSEPTTPIVSILPSGFGYVDLDRLTVAEVDKMFETIKETSAVIFDMRGYPNGTAWEIAPRLTEKKSPIAALFSRPIWGAASLGHYEGDTNFTFVQRLPAARGDIYQGKVVMLINEEAISQAEHTCMFFKAASDVTFIGTPTKGANGDVTNTVLPGNLVVSFTGHSVRHPDGRQLQRVGIQPTIWVEPTIRGTVEGRDEILEAAIKFLQVSKTKS